MICCNSAFEQGNLDLWGYINAFIIIYIFLLLPSATRPGDTVCVCVCTWHGCHYGRRDDGHFLPPRDCHFLLLSDELAKTVRQTAVLPGKSPHRRAMPRFYSHALIVWRQRSQAARPTDVFLAIGAAEVLIDIYAWNNVRWLGWGGPLEGGGGDCVRVRHTQQVHTHVPVHVRACFCVCVSSDVSVVLTY